MNHEELVLDANDVAESVFFKQSIADLNIATAGSLRFKISSNSVSNSFDIAMIKALYQSHLLTRSLLNFRCGFEPKRLRTDITLQTLIIYIADLSDCKLSNMCYLSLILLIANTQKHIFDRFVLPILSLLSPLSRLSFLDIAV